MFCFCAMVWTFQLPKAQFDQERKQLRFLRAFRSRLAESDESLHRSLAAMHTWKDTLPQTNMEPEKAPFKRTQSSLESPFSGSMFVWQSVSPGIALLKAAKQCHSQRNDILGLCSSYPAAPWGSSIYGSRHSRGKPGAP